MLYFKLNVIVLDVHDNSSFLAMVISGVESIFSMELLSKSDNVSVVFVDLQTDDVSKPQETFEEVEWPHQHFVRVILEQLRDCDLVLGQHFFNGNAPDFGQNQDVASPDHQVSLQEQVDILLTFKLTFKHILLHFCTVRIYITVIHDILYIFTSHIVHFIF